MTHTETGRQVILRAVGVDPGRGMGLRRISCWALLAALSCAVLALAAGMGPALSIDAWAFIILAVPPLAVTLVALVLPTEAIPSSALFAGRDDRGNQGGLWRWFVAPYAVPLLTPFGLVAGAYVGAGLSELRRPVQGLGPLLFSTEDLGWYLPLIGLLSGVLLGWVGIMGVAVPLRVLAQIPALWRTDGREALRLLAFDGVALGVWLTIVAHSLVFLNAPGEDNSRLTVLRNELELLVGDPPVEVPAWTRLLAWTGLACLAAAAALVHRSRGPTKD